ncbi:LysR family transcriptional regulator [Labrys okinawensis]|uniref:LysR family transcriptional regulator n=1 Tax=Labrys okinawensis TaxID=346911 RepID=UPI0039BD68C1
MMRHASLDDLAAFACVARLRSFTRAAAELGTSTSNLSHTIKRLEEGLGVRLLQRNSRSVSASDAGEELLRSIAPAFQSIDGAMEALQRSRNRVSGTLRLTATRQAYEMVIRPVLPVFAAAHPDATVEVLIEYAFRDIIADQFDAGIRLGEKIEQDMIALKVGPDLRMAVAAAPSYLARHGTPQHPRDLMGHRCINYRMVAAGTIYAWEFERNGLAFEMRVPGPLTFNEPGLMLDCALDGLGIAYLLEHEVAPHIARGTLTRLLDDWTAPFPGFFLYYPSRQQLRPVLAAFLDLLRRQSGQRIAVPE